MVTRPGRYGAILEKKQNNPKKPAIWILCAYYWFLQKHPVFPILKTFFYFLSVFYLGSRLTFGINIFYKSSEDISI